MGVKISKSYSAYILQSNVFKLVLTFPPNGDHKKCVGVFGNFEFPTFNDSFRIFQLHHRSLRKNQKPQIFGKRAVVEQNGLTFGTRE